MPPGVAERDGRGRDRLPRILVLLEAEAALPWQLGGGLAPCVRELNANLGRADAPAMGDDARERRFVVIGIKAEATVGDAAAPLHVGRFDHHQRGARVGEHAEMAEVPIVGRAIVGAVLAHR